jgi:hypothetical protein
MNRPQSNFPKPHGPAYGFPQMIVTSYNDAALEVDHISSELAQGGFAMKRLCILFALLISIPALGEKMTGYISDDKCAASGSKAAKATDWINPNLFESCAKKCAKAGASVVFVTEDNKVLKLDADSTQKAMSHLGHRVSLSGTVDNGSLKIDEIASIKMENKGKPSSDVEEKMHEK